MAQTESIRKLTSEIPDKLYFRIGEVSRLCEVPAYVLRFWETEFSPLRPNKGGTGQRLYRRRDVETALRIKRLLYDEGYTIPGARQILKAEGRQKAPQLALAIVPPVTPAAHPALQAIRSELGSLLAQLSSPVSAPPAPLRPLKATRPKSNVIPAAETITLFDAPTHAGSSASSDSAPSTHSEEL